MSTDHRIESPAFAVPAPACDTHFHVFGPKTDYPVGADLRYTPPMAPLREYLTLANTLGLERYVFVQPSAYARDNSCMLDAMTMLDPAIRRGIVDIDENVPDSLLSELNARGVCGVRINVNPIKAPAPGFHRALEERIARLAGRCGEIGWQLDFLLPGWLTAELMPVLRALRINFSIAHMGMFLAADGADNPGFRQLVALLRHGEGFAWVKTTGAYRISRHPDYADIRPMAEMLGEAAPDRLIYGSDFPHLSFPDVDSGKLFNLLGEWFPDAAIRRRILVDNPRQLYRFDAAEPVRVE